MLSPTRARGFRPVMGRLVLALVLAGVVGGIAAAPARADDDWRRHERLDRERAARDEWRDHHRRRVYVAPPPAYVCAPPPVVYAPPPPPAGINLIFPLNIR
jgi:hypothetical protein